MLFLGRTSHLKLCRTTANDGCVNHLNFININLFSFRSHFHTSELKRFEWRNMAGYLVRSRASNLPKFELSVWIVNLVLSLD